jgi:hypothetical protein
LHTKWDRAPSCHHIHHLAHGTLQSPASVCVAGFPAAFMKKGPNSSPNCQVWKIRLCLYCHSSWLQWTKLCQFILPFVLNGASPVRNILISLGLDSGIVRKHWKNFIHLEGHHNSKHAARVDHVPQVPENNIKCDIYSSV